MKFSNKEFVHWHVHSENSKFDGLAKLDELVMRAREMGFPALALTDHGNIQGWIQFLKLARATKDKKGNDIPYAPIKPILGCEFYLSRKMDIGQYDEKMKKKGEPVRQQPDKRKGNRHLNLYAMNFKGYKNICRLSQASFTRGFYSDPRIDITTLAEHSEGVMIGSACLSSLINVNLMYGRYNEAKQVCTTLKDIFGENFFLEIMYHGIPEEREILPYIFQLSKELEIPVVATNDSHYIHKEQGRSQELLMCMSQQRCIKDSKRLNFRHMEFYLKSADEMYKLFKGHPEALVNSRVLAERINTKDIEENLFGGMRLPIFDIPSEHKDPFEYMEKLAWEGMKKIGWDKSQPHIDALKMEINDVLVARDNNNYDFATYFLIVKDYIENARDNGVLVGCGRGSGYASVLLRCLGITYGADPLEYGLLWERFLGFSDSRFIKENDFGFETDIIQQTLDMDVGGDVEEDFNG